MAKYKVLHSNVSLPFYPDKDKGAPLPASQSSVENAAKDEYGRARVGHFILTQGKEFYAGEGDDDLFYTHDTKVAERYLYYGAVEQVGEETQQEEEKPAVVDGDEKPKARQAKNKKVASEE